MGYMDLTVIGSDLAADLNHEVNSAIARVLRRGLKEKGNDWNTSGSVNVGMWFNEVACKNKALFAHDEMRNVAAKTLDMLEKRELIEAADKDQWDDESNRQYHSSTYKKIALSLREFIKYCDNY